MKTAQESRNEALMQSTVKSFLDGADAEIKKAVAAEKLECKYTIYSDAIGDVYALYNNTPEKCLTGAGKAAVKKLEDLGYKVQLSLYYEERQFVDMRLQFNISW